MNLEVNKWKPFRVDSIFDIYTGGDLIMGDVEPGDIPIASNSAENNNIATYSGVIPDRKLFDHTKSISIADRGKFWAFIQPRDFYLATRVKGLVCKDYNMLNAYQMIFVVTVLNQESFKFSYGRNCCANLPDIELYLPIKYNRDGTVFIDNSHKYSDDGVAPDWQFMEDYIKSLNHKPLTTKNKPHNNSSLNVNKWKMFRVGDLFNIRPTKTVDGVSADDCVGHGYPLVVNSAENNGVAGFCDIEPTEQGNIITFSDTTDGNTFFYQPAPFIGFAHVQGMYPKKKGITKSVMLFICSMLMFDSKGRYNYGRKMRRDIISDVILKLPASASGDPDWQFMEEYIKALPYGDRLNG